MAANTNVPLYRYEELGLKARLAALDWFQGTVEVDSWLEYPLESFKEIADIIGIRINGELRWCVGPYGGVAWNGYWSWQTGTMDALRESWINDEELGDIVAQLHDAARRSFYSASAIFVETGYRVPSMNIEVEQWLGESVEDRIVKAFERLAGWLYNMLEAAYEDAYSEEYAAEGLANSLYWFHACGKKATKAEEEAADALRGAAN